MNKKKLIFLGLDVLVLVITIGVSLAVFNYVKKGENPNRVTAGAITMNFTEGVRNISLPVATPTSDEEGRSFGLDGSTCQNDSENNVQCYTDFTISTNMNIDYSISYEVTLEKDEETTLNNDDVRIYLEKLDENDEYKEVFSPKAFEEIDSENPTETDELGASNSEMLLDSGSITSSTTYNYRLRIWLSSDYTFTNETKDFVGKINVYGSNVEINATGGITLSKTDLIIQKGDTKQIIATVKPDNAKNQNLIWKSNDPSKVKVDSLGNIIAIDITEAPVTITVYTKDKEHAAECTIIVVNYDARSVELNTKEVTLSKGNTYQLTSTVTPTDAEDTRVTYKSSSEGIATISNNGLITAVGVGETTIIVETINGYTDTCKVIVTEPNVTNISINGDDNVDVGSTIQLSTTITSDSLESNNIIWESSDESKATVSSTGKVTGIAPGTITITAYIKEYPNIKTTKTIEVEYPEIKSITMSSDMTINYGNSTTFSIWISPNQVRNQDKIRWISSNTSVATIPSSCNGSLSCAVEGISDGTTTIKAVVVDDEEVETTIFDTSTLTVNISNLLSHYLINLRAKGDSTLIDDGTSDHNIRYSGATVKNYVNFNCDSDGSNCELWRIIGVMNNIKFSKNGVGQTRVKIIRASSIGGISWDSSSSDINNGQGENKWEEASLMKILNPGYENNEDYNENSDLVLVNNSLYWNRISGQCHNDANNKVYNCNYSTKGLKDSTKNMIGVAYWNLGASSSLDITTSKLYSEERGTTPNGSNGAIGWTGMVGLMYPSDYSYAGYFCNKGEKVNNCFTSSWMYMNWHEHLLTSPSNSATNIWYLSWNSSILSATPKWGGNVRPTIYLKSNVIVKQDGADGSENKPYNIALGS